MNETVKINAQDISVKVYNGQRVITFKDIDTVHNRADGTARKRFNDNRIHFIEQVDYFVRNTDEAANEFGIVAPNGLMLLTESGYLMLVKSLTDNLAWDVQRELVNKYFKPQDKPARRCVCPPKSSSVGEIASLVKINQLIMSEQKSSPSKIARQTELFYEYAGLPIIPSYSEPSYEQMTLTSTTRETTTTVSLPPRK